MEITGPTKLPSIKITRDLVSDSYTCEWPDGVKMRVNGFEVAHGEDIRQVAIELRQRAGL